MKNETAIRRALRWTMMPVVLVVMTLLVNVLNRPGAERLDTARRALAAAGYPDARLSRQQVPSELSRCEVGQIQDKGYAYAWEAEAHHGIFCLPVDGRPSSILVDR